jgi:hypothetical protein
MARDPRPARNVAGHLATKAHLLMTRFEHGMLPALQRQELAAVCPGSTPAIAASAA